MSYKVITIIISYDSLEECMLTVDAIYQQTSHIIIIDNFSTKYLSNELVNLYGNNKNITLLLLDQNYGIGYALNRGVEIALSMNYDWILTMDQDSIASPKMLDSMFDCIDSIYENHNKLQTCIFSSFMKNNPPKPCCKEIYMGITSGNLLHSDIYKNFGGYNEEFFIDSVDFEFFLRIKNNGIKFFQATNAAMEHSLGDKNEGSFISIQNNYTHSPLRRYYISRNHFYLCKLYFFNNPIYLTWKTINLIRLLLQIILFEKEKKKNLHMFFKGIKHFFQGKTGKL